MKRILLFVSLVIFFSGCQSVSSRRGVKASKVSEAKALSTVVSSVSGQEINQRDLRKLREEIKNNPEAKSAVKSMSNAITGENIIVKYCPEDGKRYSANLEYCPGTKIPLKIVE